MPVISNLCTFHLVTLTYISYTIFRYAQNRYGLTPSISAVKFNQLIPDTSIAKNTSLIYLSMPTFSSTSKLSNVPTISILLISDICCFIYESLILIRPPNDNPATVISL